MHNKHSDVQTLSCSRTDVPNSSRTACSVGASSIPSRPCSLTELASLLWWNWLYQQPTSVLRQGFFKKGTNVNHYLSFLSLTFRDKGSADRTCRLSSAALHSPRYEQNSCERQNMICWPSANLLNISIQHLITSPCSCLCACANKMCNIPLKRYGFFSHVQCTQHGWTVYKKDVQWMVSRPQELYCPLLVLHYNSNIRDACNL